MPPAAGRWPARMRPGAGASSMRLTKKAPPNGGAFALGRRWGSVAAATPAAAGRDVAVGGAERAAAGTGAFGVGVREGEALAHEPIDVVELGAAEHAGAHGVQQDAHAVALDDQIVALFVGLVEHHAVGH